MGYYSSCSLSIEFQKKQSVCGQVGVYIASIPAAPILHRTLSCSGLLSQSGLELSSASIPTFQNLPNYGSLKRRLTACGMSYRYFPPSPEMSSYAFLLYYLCLHTFKHTQTHVSRMMPSVFITADPEGFAALDVS